ncbi:MAG: porin [Thermoanaerobaculia bacterium]
MKHRFRRTWTACLSFALVAAAALSMPVAAQEAFYQEVARDGRLYVFSSEQNLRAWEASKELTVGTITRPGYGPNGETVVFDGPRAVELFNQKYGKSDAPPKEVKSEEVKLPFNVQYRMPGLRLTFPKFEFNWTNRMQIRFTYDDPDSAALQSNRASFRIRRFKTKFDGWIYSRNLTYEFQVNWVGLGISGFNTPLVEDANLDYDFTGGKRAFRLKVGQFKAPFGRQELTSSGNQQFVDRSIASVLFAPSRQVGAQIHGQLGSASVPDMVTYAAGVFNGNGIVQPTNDNDEMEYVARLMFSPVGNVGYSESNLEGYDFRVSVGGGYNRNPSVVRPLTGAPTGIDVVSEYGADVVIKAIKVLSVYGEYYWRNLRDGAGMHTCQTGFTGQIGVLFLPRWEIAGRWSETNLNVDRDDRNIREQRVGLSWYANRHNWKVQGDYGWLKAENLNGANGQPPARNKDFRIQAQLIF